MHRKLLFAVLFFSVTVCAPSFHPTSQAQAPAKPTDTMKMEHPAAPIKPGSADKLKITFGEKSAEYTLQDLALLDHHAIDVVNGHTKANEHYAGVLLSTLLSRVGVPDKPHGKDFRLYIVAEGADGYQVVYSLGEVTPDVHDSTSSLPTPWAPKTSPRTAPSN